MPGRIGKERPGDGDGRASLDREGRPEPPLAGDEMTTLLGFLEYQRAEFMWRCRGLDAASLNTSVGVSSLTLGGLLKHLAYIEDYWFSQRLHGRDWRPPVATGDWPADPDWDWHVRSAVQDTPEQLEAIWRAAVEASRSCLSEAPAAGGLSRLASRPWPNGERPSLRWILVHMIEEYARHNGHAGVFREAVDSGLGD